MPIRVKVGSQIVEFPDGTSQDEMRAALDKLPAQGSDQSKSWIDSVGDYLSEALTGVNPKNINAGIQQAFWHPVDTVKSIGQAQGDLKVKAEEAFSKGDYATGIRHTLSYLLPLVGPRIDQASDYAQNGEFSKSLGATTDVAIQTMGPQAATRVVQALPRMPFARPANPAIAEAVRFGQRQGAKLDAATATDNTAVRAAQHISDRSLGGAQIAGRANQAQAESMATIGGRLADQAHPAPVTTEGAGQAIRASVEQNISNLGAQADSAYGRLRAIEAKRPIPVDLATVKTAIEPIYAAIAKGADIAPLQGSKAAAARAMARILEGPDVADASIVDSALSDLKALQRDVSGTPGAGAANRAVDAVHRAVMNAVTKAGPDAVAALNEGRAATTAKYVAQDVLDGLNAEPVRTTRGLTAPGDAAIEQLRAIQSQAPKTVPQIARSVLDALLDKATEAGGFAHADKLYADWKKLGPETKALLFPDAAFRRDLDSFFLLAKQMEKNANPSGTAHTVAMLAQGSQITNPVHFVATVAGSMGLSAFLHSPTGVRLLTEGLRLPASGRAAWAGRVKAFAKGLQGATVAGETAAAAPAK